jgi:hypothetical protein
MQVEGNTPGLRVVVPPLRAARQLVRRPPEVEVLPSQWPGWQVDCPLSSCEK